MTIEVAQENGLTEVPENKGVERASVPLKKWEAPRCIMLPVSHTSFGIGCGVDGGCGFGLS